MNEILSKRLVKKALNSLNNSYSPYSRVRVAACAVDEKDNEYIGVNVENASYGATVCAERSAMFSAMSNGGKKLKYIAIASDSDKFTMPCGLCRQVMMELCNKDAEIICANKDGNYKIFKIDELVPHPFKI